MDADSGRHLSKLPRWKVSVAWSADDRLWRKAVVRRVFRLRTSQMRFAIEAHALISLITVPEDSFISV
jgi:hypothetical protein